MASAVDSRLAYARLSAVAMASRLPTANRGSTNSYTTSWDTTNLNPANAANSPTKREAANKTRDKNSVRLMSIRWRIICRKPSFGDGADVLARRC